MSEDRPSVLLWKPKTPENIGHALRVCRCFGASLLVVEPRCALNKTKTKRRIRSTATHAANYDWRVISESGATSLMTLGSTVPIEIQDDSVRLERFEHPADALYVFGPEEGAVPASITEVYGPSVVIPSIACLNLAAAVSVVLYDRAAKVA